MKTICRKIVVIGDMYESSFFGVYVMFCKRQRLFDLEKETMYSHNVYLEPMSY